jgi:hypothetical protein
MYLFYYYLIIAEIKILIEIIVKIIKIWNHYFVYNKSNIFTVKSGIKCRIFSPH